MKKLMFSILLVSVSISLGQNTTLRDTTNEFDYVIITLPEFEQTCLPFKQHKETYNNFSVLITTKQKILSEFNDSVQVEENIRDFISYAATFWQTPTPKYFLFTGDVDRMPNFEFESIPGYPETDTAKSDYFYGINKYDDTQFVSLFVGRIASRTELELNNYFNKVISYENNPTILPWQNKTLLVADDHYTPSHYNGDIFETIISDMVNLLPDYINSKLIFENDSSSYYGTTDSIVNYINNVGVSSIYFCGHGNRNIFTHDSLFTVDDVSLLNNNPKYFFFGSLYGQKFSTLDSTSMIDQMMFSQNGAISGIVSVGLNYLSTNSYFYQNLWQNLYTNKHMGEIFKNAVNQHPSIYEAKKYNIFGDPSLVLKYDQIASNDDDNYPRLNSFELHQNFPNPFNPTTTISFVIPKEGHVSLEIYDIIGNNVANLIDERLSQGSYNVDFDASNFSSGIYFYRLDYNSNVIAKKMILLK